MNRQQRRNANKSKPAYLRESPEDIKKRMVKNGITPEDLKSNYDKGWHDGFKEAAEPIVKGCFAAICLALNDLHGFGTKRCMDVLNKVDEHLTYTLATDEAIEQVWKRIGLKLEFKEPFDRIKEV